MDKFSSFVFRPYQKGIRKVLGELETDIMEIIWQEPAGEGVSVRDIYEKLRLRRPLAYTTVMTTMSRLSKKGLLSADKAGQAHIYRPLLTQKELGERIVSQLFDSLLSDLSAPALSYFQSSVQPADREEIERLLHEVEKKRREAR